MFSLKMFPHLHYHYDKLTEFKLPNDIKKYMSDKGLPILDNANWGDIEAIVFYEESMLSFYDKNNKFIIIGILYDLHYICLNIDDGGVYMINNGIHSDSLTSIELPELANSSLSLFIEFISIYYYYVNKYRVKFENYEEEIAIFVSNELEKEFRARDEAIMDDENSFWSVRVEEIAYMI